MLPRRRLLGAAAIAAALPATTATAVRAAAFGADRRPDPALDRWPERPIRLIAVAPPGSSLDVLARLFAERLHERLGQPVVVDNRPQAGGTVGTDAVAKAAPDGYTLGLSYTGPLSLAPLLYARLPYAPTRDLAPVALLGTAPNLLAVHPQVPVDSFDAFIAHVRARPGQLNYASVGNGSSSHLAMELLKLRGQLFIVHIPYNGAPPAVQATAAGDVQVLMSNPTSLLPLVRAGRLRALAVTSATRWPGMKELPTIAERGFAGFESTAWNGFVAPAGTPEPLLDRLWSELDAALRDPVLRGKLDMAGWEAQPRNRADFGRLIAQETERYRDVVKRADVHLD